MARRRKHGDGCPAFQTKRYAFRIFRTSGYRHPLNSRSVLIQIYFSWNTIKEIPPLIWRRETYEWKNLSVQRIIRMANLTHIMRDGMGSRRGGLARGQFFYHVVAQIVDGEPDKVIQYPVSEHLHLEKTAEWQTRTRSEMRKVANIEAKKRHAIASSNQKLFDEAEHEMDDITVLAPRLAAINFDLGLTVEDLRQIARSPRIPVILQKTVKRTLAAYEK